MVRRRTKFYCGDFVATPHALIQNAIPRFPRHRIPLKT